ncbi:HD-GYP domain-containing protein [Streptomyces sp. NPDC058953]|uniref:HD-GYP domain-containing protein n=1 Tax=unclassified Streptomyces TaxID=2593676 RepID=UPI0036B2342C
MRGRGSVPRARDGSAPESATPEAVGKRRRLLRLLPVVGVYGAAGILAPVAVASVALNGVHHTGIALGFGLLITVGEAARHPTGPGEREPAPLGAAGVLAYALLGECAGRLTAPGTLQVVAVVLLATLAGSLPRTLHGDRGRGRGRAFAELRDHLARRILVAAFAAVCFRPLYAAGPPEDQTAGALYALAVLVLLMLTALCDSVLRAAVRGSRTGFPYGSLLREELRALPGIGSAVCATGVVMALSVSVAGLWALPVFSLPLLLTQLSLSRYEAVKATYRQTIASLARATEVAGYTPPGHARRVADLAVAVGRELRLGGGDLTVLEYAALMHDIGQLSLVDPVPGGATARLPAAEQRRIALLGGAVVRRTGVPAAVAVVVERQADPYRDQPLTARIVRTVNAYDDLTGGTGRENGPYAPGASRPATPLDALERLRLATGRDHQPEVVEALAAVLARGRPNRPRTPAEPG